VLEALEVPLFTLEEATKLNPDWLKSDNNWIYPGSLTKDLLQKEVWGARLEKLKSDKARDIRVGHFLRGFQSESEHCRSGTRYRLLALAGSLLQHLPTGTMVQGEKYDIRAMIQRLSLSRDVASSHVTECPEDVASKATSYEDPVTSDSETSPESRTPGVSDDPPTNDGIASGHDGGNGPSHDGSAGYDVEDL
jgi:hypothetical protein